MFYSGDMTQSSFTTRAKGRAARSNPSGRYLSHQREAFDDGWAREEEEEPLRTEIRQERPRSIITRNSSPDLSFAQSMNPYRGCEHGCIYCYARPGHAWLDMSPGLDFETRLVAKPTAPEVLARQLSAPRYVPKVIVLGSNTDPYQPIERTQQITRRLLETLWEFRHPVSVLSRGTLIERDLELLAEMAAQGLAEVGVSVTTLDRHLARAMEPRVPPPARRLETIRRLSGAGVPVRVMVSPIIPALTDHELEPILEAAAEAGARSATQIPLRLPLEVADLFKDWLQAHVPDRAARVMGRVRELYGGKEYDSRFGTRFTGQGVWSDLIRLRGRVARARLGLDGPMPPLRTDLFRVPARPGDQLSLF